MQLHKTYYDSADNNPLSLWFRFKDKTWIYRTYEDQFDICQQDYINPKHPFHHDMKPIPHNWIIGTQGQTTN